MPQSLFLKLSRCTSNTKMLVAFFHLKPSAKLKFKIRSFHKKFLMKFHKERVLIIRGRSFLNIYSINRNQRFIVTVRLKQFPDHVLLQVV